METTEKIIKREYLKPYLVLQLQDEAIAKGLPLPFDEIHFLGSKLSGKTHAELKHICKNASTRDDVEARLYRFRQGDIRRFAYDIESKLSKEQIYFRDKIGFDSGRKTRGVFYNGNKIEIEATDQARKKELGQYGGLNEFTKTYGLTFFEEMYEYPEANYKELTGAFRGAKYMCIYHASNPWKERSWYVRKMLKYLPWNEPIMKTRGWNATKLTIEENKHGIIITKKIAIVWTNWRVNKEHLSKGDIQAIMNYYDISEQAGETADLGKAGSESSGVYIDRMHHIKTKPYLTNCERIGGGGDIGLGKSNKSGLTAFLFSTYDHRGHKKYHYKWKWDMKRNPISITELYSQVVDFYVECWMKYKLATHDNMIGRECEVRVDLSNQEFIDNCNVIAERRGLTWLVFTPCTKGNIMPRILCTWNLMDNDRLEIDEEEIPELFEELENSEWVDVDGKRVRANKDDHFINAMEYDFEPEQEEGLLTGDIDTQAESFWKSSKW